MSIKNYTTSINAHKTVGEIQQMLAKHKAKAILTEYDDDGTVTAVSFKIETKHGIVPYRLPANIDGIFKRMYRDPKVPKAKKTREQATMVAWRILKDWIDAQLAIIDSEMVDITEAFLPYAQTKSGKTVYQIFDQSPNKLLLTE